VKTKFWKGFTTGKGRSYFWLTSGLNQYRKTQTVFKNTQNLEKRKESKEGNAQSSKQDPKRASS
jgi:hypothetical protein